MILSLHSRGYVSRRIARRVSYLPAICLITSGVCLIASTAYGLTNHPPRVSWIKDQAVTASNQFAPVYFRAWDKETDPLPSPTPIIENDTTTPNFIAPGSVHIATCLPSEAGCPPDHGYKVTFDPLTHGDGAATIVITATDGGNAAKSAASSFTLRKQSAAINPPRIAGIPNEQIQAVAVTGLGYGPVWFVVDDLDANGVDDAIGLNGDSTVTPSGVSDNHAVVQDAGIHFEPPLNGLKWSLTVFPVLNATGRAVITVTFTDSQLPVHFKTSTSFVLDVISASNTAPSFTPAPGASGTWIEHDVTQSQTIVYNFKVTDSQTPKSQLLVTATSSNANLVPNDTTHLIVSSISSTGTGTLTIKPLPLPSPSPGVPQAATITLAVTDDAYTRRKQFLYVAKHPASPALSFSRPTGVYNLDPKAPADQRPNDPFLTGEMHRISWREIDNGGPPATWDWSELNDAVANLPNLPNGQDLSLNLFEEPCDIAESSQLQFAPWCDIAPPAGQLECNSPCGSGGVKRAVPWDSYLRTRRNTFLQELARHVIPATGNTVANEPLIPIINPNLPGGDSGIRELDGMPFDAANLPGYTRTNLLNAVKDELDHVLLNFPAKLVQIGFFTAEDVLDDQYANESLWHWLYPRLRDRYNGIVRPRVHFFQEDLAAARASAAPDYIPYIPPPNTTAYSFTPNHCQLPSFAFNCGDDGDCDPNVTCTPSDSEYNNGIVFQANTPWSGPFADGDKVTKTLNGTPNDGIEAAFNAYLSEYLEVYQGDLDHAKPPLGMAAAWDAARWAAGLQSWHDYTAYLRTLAPSEAPAGLTVTRDSATSNTVSWYGVYGASTYTLQRKVLSPPGAWTNVTGCDPASTSCTDTASTGSQYAYRVQACNGTHLSPWAQVAVFLSESNNDGYVSASGETYTPVNNVTGPGIQAGQGAGTDLSGFLSFDTSSLGSAATVLNAKLRLKQFSNNNGFDALGPCIADIQKDDFNDRAELEGADFNALETDFDVTEEGELAGVDSGNWVEAELDPLYVGDVNNTDRTQFRLWFEHIDGLSDKSVQWYSSESAGNEPQLIVQYAEL